MENQTKKVGPRLIEVAGTITTLSNQKVTVLIRKPKNNPQLTTAASNQERIAA